jgi:pimeloyl-ACP methyl ester carboxylesterase
MKKRYLLAGIGGIAGAAIAYKLLSRASETDWEQFAGSLHHGERSQFAEVDGLRIHYQEFGESTAPTIILIHGFSASTYTWRETAPLLAEKGFRVLVVDLIGFGFSQKPKWLDYTIEMQAEMIVRFMNRLGIGRATLIGSSYGGAVAQSVALDDPERVEKLVLVGTVFNDEVRKMPLTKLVTLPLFGEALTPFLTSSKTYIRARMRHTLATTNHNLIDENRIQSVMRPLQAADAHRSLFRTLRNWNASRLEQNAEFIEHPTLLVWGEDDRVIPLHNGIALHRAIKDSRLVVFKDCGHVPHEEYAEDFVELAGEFCQAR